MRNHDLAILGGGISGLSLAVEAAARGYNTTLFEAGRCCHATSDNTLRIIHGGFRYLQQAHIPRVIRSLDDQSHVWNTYRAAVEPLACLMPLNRWGLKSRAPVWMANSMYGAIMKIRRSPLPTPSILGAKAVATLVPELTRHAPNGALCWYDLVMVEPRRIADALLTQARELGVAIREETHVTGVSLDAQHLAVTTADGEHHHYHSVINALGPWLGAISLPEALKGPRPHWCKGFNITIARRLHPTHAIGIQSSEGRLFFCVPRGSGTAIGTWYVPLPTMTEAPTATSREVTPDELSTFIAAFNKALPEYSITPADITSVDVGILPMKRDTPSGPLLYGAERLHSKGGYHEIISTKYTTFRSQAVRALARVERHYS